MKQQPALGVTEEMIASAEEELGIRLPDVLKEAWQAYNCNEISGWRFFPVFDPANPRKTCGSITYENLKGAWGRTVMSLGLLSIASNGTGNQLVLKVLAGAEGDAVYRWHHATHKLALWKPGLVALKRHAGKSRAEVLSLHERFRNAG